MGVFRKRKERRGMSAEASLAEAEAALRAQRQKLAAEQQVHRKLDRLAGENDLARRFREAFGGSR